MATTGNSDARELITLAERMGLPADEALRQVALLIADDAAVPTLIPAPAPVIAAVSAGSAL
jgi:hypothetical protein